MGNKNFNWKEWEQWEAEAPKPASTPAVIHVINDNRIIYNVVQTVISYGNTQPAPQINLIDDRNDAMAEAERRLRLPMSKEERALLGPWQCFGP